ncbi:MAG: hypothetical protein EOO29_35525 [Comamonadaceae bacterium]|nr:MAG: hypothetical protein EOO29_35525 [Comamonadaceae bacterium]
MQATVPAWWTEARKQARSLAGTVKAACLVLWAEVRLAVTTADTDLVAFNYESDLNQAIAEAKAHGNRYRVGVLTRQKQRLQDSRFFAKGCPRCEHQWVTMDRAFEKLWQTAWPRCCNCNAAWHPDGWENARIELASED